MRALVQRVQRASARVGATTVGEIGPGLAVLLGVAAGDTHRDADYLAGKIATLRVFAAPGAQFALSVQDVGGGILVVSQFTLYGDCRKGRRPSFTAAAGAEHALALYEYFVQAVRRLHSPVETGSFQTDMLVHLVNDGPVTLLLDSPAQPPH